MSSPFSQRLNPAATPAGGASGLLRGDLPTPRLPVPDFSDLDTRESIFSPLPARIEPGTHIDEFEVVEEIGRGGSSTVYRAHQPSQERDVALKVLAPELGVSSHAAERFHREAELSRRIAQPGVVPTFHHGVDGGYHYQSMKLMSLPTLSEFLQGQVTTPTQEFFRDAAIVVAHLARTVAALHAMGILHRDIKPGNIFVEWPDRTFLADFGVAVDLEDRNSIEAAADEETPDGRALYGTPAYLSPERFVKKDAAFDPRIDIYSIGLTLYESVTGFHPFRGQSDEEIARQKLTRLPPSPRSVRPQVPLGLEAIVRQAIEVHVDLRYQTPDELARDLERFANSRRTNTRTHHSQGLPPAEPGTPEAEPDVDSGDGTEPDGQPALLC